MKNKLFTLVLAVGFYGATFAQEKISIQQAIDMGLKNNPMLKMAGGKVKIAEAKLLQSEEQCLPHSDVSLAYSHFQLLTPFALKFGDAPKPLFVMPATSFNATIGSASIAENVFSGFRVRSNIKSAEYLVKAAKLDTEKDRADLSYTIASAYFNIYKIIKSGEIIDENIKALDEKLREIKSLQANGIVLRNDVLKVELQKTNLQMSKLEVESAKNSALYSLGIMTGMADNANYTIDTNSLFTSSPTLAVADLQNQALAERKELQSTGMKLKSANENINVLKSYYYPSFGVALNYYFINPSDKILPENQGFINAGGLGVNLSYNISALWEKGKLEEAHANVLQLGNITEGQSNQIKTEVFSNYNNWKLSTDKIALTQSAIDQASENYRTMNSRYKNNISTMTELMDANTLLLQAQLNKVNAITDEKLAYLKLMNSVGK